jgi:hypothetical protein
MTDQPNPQVDKWVKQYIGLRDALKALEAIHKEKTDQYKTLMETLGGKLQDFLDNAGVESAKTSEGTVYSTTRYTASLSDPNAFMSYVKMHEMWDLLDKRANASACRDFVTEHKSLPPGVNLNALKTVGVRRPTGG